MTLSLPTLQFGSVAGASQQTLASGALTIPAGALVLAGCLATRNAGTPDPPTVTDDLSALSFLGVAGGGTVGYRVSLQWAYDASGGTRTLTQDWGAAKIPDDQGLFVVTYTGADSSGPTNNIGSTGSGAAATLTLSSSPAATSSVVMLTLDATATLTGHSAGSGFTELGAGLLATAAILPMAGYFTYGQNGTTASTTLAGSETWRAVAVEILEATGSAGTLDRISARIGLQPGPFGLRARRSAAWL